MLVNGDHARFFCFYGKMELQACIDGHSYLESSTFLCTLSDEKPNMNFSSFLQYVES